MDVSTINYWAVLVAAVAAFAVGALWYSPVLFGKAWMHAAGMTEEKLQQGNMAKIFGLAFVFELVMAGNLAIFLNDSGTDLAWGATAGFLAGFGWVALGLAVVGLFEHKSWKYIAINGGYLVVSFVIMGAILGGWR